MALPFNEIGYGAGTKQFQNFPNCVRLLIGEERDVQRQTAASVSAGLDEITVIEANIDDMTPQNFVYVTERLLEAGALDVFTFAGQMKKGRPGHLLQVLAPVDRSDELSHIIFEETTTIGVRQHTATRTMLEREIVPVETEFGTVRVKVSKLNGRPVTYTPEFDDCVRLPARERGPEGCTIRGHPEVRKHAP